MPKILDYLKEKDISHTDLIAYLEKNGLPKPPEEVDEKEGEEEEVPDKPESKIELRITSMVDEKLKPDEEENDDKTITLTPEELEVKINDAIIKKLKAELKVPSKGNLTDKPPKELNTVKKNWFEEIV